MMTTPALAQNVRGKGRHYAGPDGELVPSVTNVISALSKGDALTRWSAKMVAETAYRMRHALPDMEEHEAVTMLKQSPWARSQRAADRGTDIHGYLEARLNGWDVDELSADAKQYKASADAWLEANSGIEVIATELTVFNPAYAGTMDLLCRIDGKMTIADWKTSKAIYDEAALQLAALYGCTTDADGDPVPWRDAKGLPTEPVDLLVIRIGEDKHETKQVADVDGALIAFISLLEAWHWRHGKAYL